MEQEKEEAFLASCCFLLLLFHSSNCAENRYLLSSDLKVQESCGVSGIIDGLGGRIKAKMIVCSRVLQVSAVFRPIFSIYIKK